MDWPELRANWQQTGCQNCLNDNEEWCQMKLNIWCCGKRERSQSLFGPFMGIDLIRLITQTYWALPQSLYTLSTSIHFFIEALLYAAIKWVETYSAPTELHLSLWWWLVLIEYKRRMPPTQNCCIYTILQETMKSRREDIHSSSSLDALKDMSAVSRQIPLIKNHGELCIERIYITEILQLSMLEVAFIRCWYTKLWGSRPDVFFLLLSFCCFLPF